MFAHGKINHCTYCLIFIAKYKEKSAKGCKDFCTVKYIKKRKLKKKKEMSKRDHLLQSC